MTTNISIDFEFFSVDSTSNSRVYTEFNKFVRVYTEFSKKTSSLKFHLPSSNWLVNSNGLTRKFDNPI